MTLWDNNELNISWLCQNAGVSRSGYYAWLDSAYERSEKDAHDKADFDLILQAYQFRGYDKGRRGIYMRLLNMGIRMNQKKISRLMKKFNLRCPIRKANSYRRMAKALQSSNVAENLVKREFKKHGPRKILLTDITYMSYSNGCKAYISTIIDAFTKQVLSYVLSESLEVDFVLETIHILINKHGISLSSETLIHSDQGCHYTSIRFQELIRDKELRQSMSRRGNCLDNAPQESFFGHMKDEIHIERCDTFATIMNDHKENDDFRRFLVDSFKTANEIIKPGGAFYIWHADSEGLNFRGACFDIGWQICQCLVWVKNSLVLGRQDYQWRHEPCLYGWKDGAGHYFTSDRSQDTVIDDKLDINDLKKDEMKALLKQLLVDRIQTTVIYEDKPAKNDVHPTMKPIKLIARLVENSFRKNDNVLELFGGSGSTLIACEQLHRKC